MKMEARLGAASCTQGLQIYSQEEVSPCLLEILSCSEIGQPSENTPEQLGQVLPHMLEWEQTVRGCRECHRCWGSPSFILRNC